MLSYRNHQRKSACRFGHLCLLIIAAAALTCAGCTGRAWFEGFKEGQRQACYQYKEQDEVRRCLANVDRMDYDEYKKSRTAEKKQIEKHQENLEKGGLK